MSHVVWNVDGQRGDLGLHRLHRRLRGFALGFLPAGQRRERDLDVGAGEAEGAPAAAERRRIFALEIHPSVMEQRVSPTPPGQSLAPTPAGRFVQSTLKREEDQARP